MNNNTRIFSNKYIVSNDTRKTGLNNNDAIIGASGSSKTGGYVIHNIWNSAENMIVVDTKGNIYSKVSDHLESKGYKVMLLDAVNPERSTVGFNPFDYIEHKPDGSFNENNISSIAAAMIPINDPKDTFWVLSARAVMESAMGYVIETMDKDCHNLNSFFLTINNILKNNTNDYIEFMEDAVKNSFMKENSFAYRKYLEYKKVMKADTTWGCITMFLTAFIDSLNVKENNAVFCNDVNIHFEDFNDEKIVLFINVSDTDRAFDKITGLILRQAFKTLCKTADSNSDGALERPVRFYLDDFATSTVIEDFDKLISVIRSRNIAVSIILQSIVQLETIYERAKASTIITNCDHLLYLGGADYETANYLSLRSGVLPETIMNLPSDKEIFLERGKKGIITDKLKPYSCLGKSRKPMTKTEKGVEI